MGFSNLATGYAYTILRTLMAVETLMYFIEQLWLVLSIHRHYANKFVQLCHDVVQNYILVDFTSSVSYSSIVVTLICVSLLSHLPHMLNNR
jgi:hypothetical protein